MGARGKRRQLEEAELVRQALKEARKEARR